MSPGHILSHGATHRTQVVQRILRKQANGLVSERAAAVLFRLALFGLDFLVLLHQGKRTYQRQYEGSEIPADRPGGVGPEAQPFCFLFIDWKRKAPQARGSNPGQETDLTYWAPPPGADRSPFLVAGRLG